MSERVKCAVVGDVILDLLRVCRFQRPSPEDEACPVLTVEREEWALGGAANVAVWLAAEPGFEVRLHGCHPFSLLAPSDHGEVFRQLCAKSGALYPMTIRSEGEFTVKERIWLADPSYPRGGRYLTRVDRDLSNQLTASEFDFLARRLAEWNPDLLVITDYAKGTFEGEWGQRLVEWLIDFSCDRWKGGQLTLINSKRVKQWVPARATYLVCNEQEWAAADLGEAPRIDGLPLAEVLAITSGPKGARIYTQCWSRTFDSLAQRVVDVTGAGDAFLAGLAAEAWAQRNYVGAAAGKTELVVAEALRWAACCCEQLGVGQPIARRKAK